MVDKLKIGLKLAGKTIATFCASIIMSPNQVAPPPFSRMGNLLLDGHMEYFEGTFIGIGYGTGPDRACEAARSALANPLIQDALGQAEGLSFSLIGGDDLTLREVNAVAELISQTVSPDASVNLAAYVRPRRAGEIRVGVAVSRQESA